MNKIQRSANPFYINKLKKELETRQQRNASYSLRAFAKYLGLDSSTLSAIIGEKRIFSAPLAIQIAKKICSSEEEIELFIKSTKAASNLKRIFSKKKVESKVELKMQHSQIISEWEHFAVLTLTEVQDFSCSANWIGERLGLPVQRVKQVLLNLETADLIRWDEQRKSFQVNREPDSPILADGDLNVLKRASQQSMEVAIEKLFTAPEGKSYFSSIDFAISTAEIEEAQTIIREFRQRLAQLFESEEKKHVYKFNLQFFPLTHESIGAAGLTPDTE